MKKIFWSFCGCLISFLCLFLFLRNDQKTHKLSQKIGHIPERDRKSLEWFFYYLNGDFSYVLFGNKPMATCCFLDTKSTSGVQPFRYSWIYFLDPLHIDNLRLRKGWETWEKYKDLFPSNTFVMTIRKYPYTPQYDWVEIVMIHKEHFLQKIRDHIEDFRTILGDQITAEEILQRCQQENIHEVLHHHAGLLGTLLGYGRNNAWLFHQFSLDKNIDGQLQSFTEGDILDFNPLLMTLPGFRVIPNDPETLNLKKDYLKQYKTIIHRYKEGNFLEITLKQLTTR